MRVLVGELVGLGLGLGEGGRDFWGKGGWGV